MRPPGRAGREWAGALLFLCVGAWALSCSLSTNVDRFIDGVCPAGAKACNGRCAPDTEPSVGCRVPGCQPCDLTNATAVCSESGTCALGLCLGDFADCNGMASDGCESDLKHDPTNCGDCGCLCGTGDATNCDLNQQVQTIANGLPGCSAGQCTIGSCNPGWGDCNGLLADGCETRTNTNANCGTCETACVAPQTCHCPLDQGNTGCACEVLDGAAE